MLESLRRRAMDINPKAAVETLNFFFPGTVNEKSGFLKSDDGKFILQRILKIPTEPIHVTHCNQLLHLLHEAGITEGFFRYYFLTLPSSHPYPVNRVMDKTPSLNPQGISSLEQLEHGLRRFFIDSLFYFGNIRSAYRELRVMGYEQLEKFFASRQFDPEENECS